MLIRLENSGRSFDAAPGEPVLDAAERAGINLPYSCRDGICGTCKARLCAGQVEHGPYASSAMSEAEREQGYFLMCCSMAKTELLVGAPVEELGFAPSPQRLACTVRRIERLAPDVALLQIALPAGMTFRFRAGQYVELIPEAGLRRSFSIANAPHDTAAIELHVRHVPDGRFTPRMFGAPGGMAEGDPITIEGPKGGFYLRDEHRPAILLASGTGFAPIKSMVLDAQRRKLAGPAHFYWGGRRASDLYLATLPAQWGQQYPAFHYVPVLSQADAEWTGRSGFVHHAVMADFPDLSGFDVYACGVPAMVNAAREDFVASCGLPPGRFYADLFLTAADRAA